MNLMLMFRLQIIDMPEYNTDQKGGTMRLGKRTTLFKRSDSIVREYIYMCVSFIDFHYDIQQHRDGGFCRLDRT